MKCFPAYWFARLLLALEVLAAVIMVSWFEPTSITSHAIAATGHYGWGIVLVLGACCAILLADVVINDMLPARWHFRAALHWRHMALLAMAMLLGLLSVLIAFANGYTSLLYVYWLNAVAAATLAYLDIFVRQFNP